MRKLAYGVALLAMLISPAFARNFAVPPENPLATITIPDTWKFEKIDFGYSALSPDKDIMFFIESAHGDRAIKKMKALNESWLKDNNIVVQGKPEKFEATYNGLPTTIESYKGKEDGEDTKVDFVLFGDSERLVVLTLWGSEEQQKANESDIINIMRSLKPIK